MRSIMVELFLCSSPCHGYLHPNFLHSFFIFLLHLQHILHIHTSSFLFHFFLHIHHFIVPPNPHYRIFHKYLLHPTLGLGDVLWRTFLNYPGTRSTNHSVRVYQTQRTTELNGIWEVLDELLSFTTRVLIRPHHTNSSVWRHKSKTIYYIELFHT